MSSYRAKVIAGEATRAALMDAETAGTIAPAQAAKLRAEFDAAEGRRAVEDAEIDRVSATLEEGATLDPADEGDRAAVDAHFRAVLLPGFEDGPAAPEYHDALIDYARETGIAPDSAVCPLGGQVLGGEDAEARAAAARAIGTLVAVDPEAAKCLPPHVLTQADRIGEATALGIPAGRAVAMAEAGTEGGWSPDLADGSEETNPTVSDATTPGSAGRELASSEKPPPSEADKERGNGERKETLPPVPAYRRDTIPSEIWRAWNEALDRAGVSPAEKRAYQEIFAAEGGNRQDGDTVSGIRTKSLTAYVRRKIVEGIPPNARPKDLTPDQKVKFYRSYIDEEMKGVPGKGRALEAIGDREAAAALADTLFRHGGPRGKEAFQNAINDVARGATPVDRDLRGGTMDAYGWLVRDPNTRQQLLDALARRRLDDVQRKDGRVLKGDRDRIDYFRFQRP